MPWDFSFILFLAFLLFPCKKVVIRILLFGKNVLTNFAVWMDRKILKTLVSTQKVSFDYFFPVLIHQHTVILKLKFISFSNFTFH